MSTHTPGPWTYASLSEARDLDWIGEVGGRAVIPLDPDRVPSRDEDIGNARLVAAAPDLLEALREARLDLIDYTAIPEIRAVVFKITEAMIRAEE